MGMPAPFYRFFFGAHGVKAVNRLILGLSAASAVGEGALRYTSIEYSFSAAMRAVWTFLFGRPSTKLVRGLVRRRMYSVEIRTTSAVTLDGEFFVPDPAQAQPPEDPEGSQEEGLDGHVCDPAFRLRHL